MAASLPTGVSRDDASLIDKVASRLPEIGLRALANLKFKIESGLVDVNRYDQWLDLFVFDFFLWPALKAIQSPQT